MRFILLFVLGSLLVVGSQVALSLGIHPDHLASLRYIIQSGTGLAIGTAIAATGLLGLAEKYQHTVSRIGPLLKRKFLGDKLHLGVRSADELGLISRTCWMQWKRLLSGERPWLLQDRV